MKFTLAIVSLALLAVGVQSSLWHGAGPSLSYGSHVVHAAGPWAGPWAGAGLGGVWHGAVGAGVGAWHGAPAAVDVSLGAPWAGHAAYGAGAYAGYPGLSLSQGVGHLGGHGHGVYVAKTRGAVHTAPLAGHVNSATALNVAPAPGTH